MFTKIKLNLEISFILASCQGNISHLTLFELDVGCQID